MWHAPKAHLIARGMAERIGHGQQISPGIVIKGRDVSERVDELAQEPVIKGLGGAAVRFRRNRATALQQRALARERGAALARNEQPGYDDEQEPMHGRERAHTGA